MPNSEIITCPNCGRKNRVPAAAAGTPRCGNCHQPLPWIHAVCAQDPSVTGLMYLWAPWCGPCRMVSPALEQLAAEMAGKLKLVKVNVDESPKLQQRFGVPGIPTLMRLRRGAGS